MPKIKVTVELTEEQIRAVQRIIDANQLVN